MSTRPTLFFITHPDVEVDPDLAVTDWSLSRTGSQRAKRFARSGKLQNVTQIWCSAERKARQTAAILAAPLGIVVRIAPNLGENDRSATGYLNAPDFAAAADVFFAHPSASFRGWERAIDAQTRIVAATTKITSQHTGRDLVVVSHGAVGTLLWCHLKDLPIDRCHDQPSQGHYWRADLPTLDPKTGWLRLG